MKLRTGIIGLLLAVLTHPAAAAAQAFPTKPIKIVVPYGPGGASDIVSRLYAQALTESLGQSVIVENKPGGGTNIAGEGVARAAPDGHTLYLASFASHSVNRWLFKKMPYDPSKDLVGVAMLSRTPQFLCVRPESPFKSAVDIIAYGRANPGKLSFGSSGNGAPNHIAGELLRYLGKFEAVHVPYKSSAEVQADLMAGQLDFTFDGSIIQHHRSGKLRCIGVSTAERWPIDPDFAAVAESVPSFDLFAYFGLTAPAATPAAVIDKLNAAVVTAANSPVLIEKLKITSAVPFPATVRETQAFLADQLARWEAVIKASGAKVD